MCIQFSHCLRLRCSIPSPPSSPLHARFSFSFGRSSFASVSPLSPASAAFYRPFREQASERASEWSRSRSRSWLVSCRLLGLFFFNGRSRFNGLTHPHAFLSASSVHSERRPCPMATGRRESQVASHHHHQQNRIQQNLLMANPGRAGDSSKAPPPCPNGLITTCRRFCLSPPVITTAHWVVISFASPVLPPDP